MRTTAADCRRAELRGKLDRAYDRLAYWADVTRILRLKLEERERDARRTRREDGARLKGRL